MRKRWHRLAWGWEQFVMRHRRLYRLHRARRQFVDGLRYAVGLPIYVSTTCPYCKHDIEVEVD